MALIRTYGYWVLILVTGVFYFLFAYNFHRYEHAILVMSFGILVALGVVLQRFLAKSSWVLLFAIGLCFRLIFLVASPRLSDDFFRFTWDGELHKDGYSAFAFTPNQYKSYVTSEHQAKYADLLHDRTAAFPEGMNSKGYYSIYPTVNQFVFSTSAMGNDPNGNNLILLRIWIVLAEIASFFLLRALLMKQNQSKWLGLYWLHPLVIIELTGNLHLEAPAITFLLLTLFFAQRNRIFASGIAVAFGVMTKLTPLLLLGALFKQFAWKQWLAICLTTVVVSVGLFSLYVDTGTFLHFKESVGLFFAWFSFNAGIYYALRESVSLITGMDISSWISLFFPFISAAIMLRITFFGKSDMVTTALLLFTTYFLFTPILHPWYITVLIPLGLLSKKLYPMLWSVFIFGTYLAYGETFQEPLWWIYAEFTLVLFVLFSEFRDTPNWIQRWASQLYS